MKVLRIAGLALLALALLLSGAAAILMANQGRVIQYVLEQVRQRTGLQIAASSAHIHFRNHLVIDLDEPYVVSGERELVKVSSARAIVSYHSILFSHGMPLYALILAHPDITVPVSSTAIASAPLPRPGVEAVQAILIALRDLGKIAWRVEMIDATAREPNGDPIVDQVGVLAFRRHLDSGLWIVQFDARVVHRPLSGLRIAGSLRAGIGRHSKPHEVARGRFWFWNAELGPVTAGAAIQAEGRAAGSLNFALNDSGKASAAGDIGVNGLTLSGRELVAHEKLGDYSLRAVIAASSQTLTLSEVTLRHAGLPIMSGHAEVGDPYGENPDLAVHMKDVAIDAGTLKARVRMIRNVPAPVLDVLGRINAGRLELTSVDFSSSMKQLRKDPFASLRTGMRFAARLSAASFTLPEDLRLPEVGALSALLRYSNNVLAAAQGSASLGGSPLKSISMRVDLTRAPDLIPYGFTLAADCDLAELFPALMHATDAIGMNARSRVDSLTGRLSVGLSASGTLTTAAAQPPSAYQIRLEPNRSVLTFKNTPGPIELARGAVVVEPGKIAIDKLEVAATGGDSLVSGSLGFGASGFRVNQLDVEMHQMPAGQWLALVVDPTDFRIVGALGGKISVRFDPKRPSQFRGTGRLVLNRGDVQFGFLRAPIVAQGAVFSLDQTKLTASMESSTLEGSPLDFRLSVADVRKPIVRINATVQAMNLEVMKFIRMPWSAATPPTHVPFPVIGRVEVHRGKLGVFVMTNMKGDFEYNDGAWRVWNFTANAYKSKMDLELSGRKKDDWIQMKGKVAHIDVGPLFLLSGVRKESPVIGTGWVAADLWANTDTDFFQTLSGKAAVTMRDGRLNRMTLMSRMLAFIDLKSWLTANFPNPTESGLPFDTVFADFKGERGTFWTENSLLQGPVMDITAGGSVDVGQNNLDLQVGMFPFTTVNWLVNKIPLIGQNVAGGTNNLLAAYFHVTGPGGDPSVTPMPVTSVTEFVKKTLGLPINIIRPNTIK